MKTRSLLLAASVGLTCGFLFKWLAPGRGSDAGNPPDRRGPQLLAGPHGTTALPDSEADKKWALRLSPYLADPVISASAAGATGPRAEADVVLRLLRQPVTADSIREGIAVLNGGAAERYDEFIASVFERWAREAPETALAAAEGLREPRQLVALVWKVFEVSAGESDILAKAMAQPRGLTRSAACAALAETLPSERAVEMLRESMKDRPPGSLTEIGGSFQASLFLKLNKLDKGLPLGLALETDDPVWRTSLLKTACNFGANPSSDQLLELLKDPRNVEGLKDEVGVRAVFKPREGMKILSGLPDTDQREAVRDIIGFSIEMLTSERLREMMPKEDREAGLSSLLSDTVNREGADGLQAIISESALARGIQGLDETARWLTSRHDAPGLDDLTRRAALAEPFTTARWLAAMPMSAERDRAVAVFAETHAAVDPEHAAVWAESISDPDKRAAALASVRKKS